MVNGEGRREEGIVLEKSCFTAITNLIHQRVNNSCKGLAAMVNNGCDKENLSHNRLMEDTVN